MNENLKRLRMAKGWSQTRLAKESGVSQTYISELEAGKSELRLNPADNQN